MRGGRASWLTLTWIIGLLADPPTWRGRRGPERRQQQVAEIDVARSADLTITLPREQSEATVPTAPMRLT